MDQDAIDSGRRKAFSDFRGACFSISAALLAGMTVTWALSATGFLLGVPVGHSQSICGAVTAVIVVYRLSNDLRQRVVRCLILILLVLLALAIAGMAVDDGYDGWLYHQPGVVGLANGWNPVVEPLFDVWWSAHGRTFGSPPDAPYVDGLWATAYPKAQWILASHALIHTADGEHFRDALAAASEGHRLPVTRIREKELWARAEAALRRPAKDLQAAVAAWGKALGPPWTQDQKLSALGAWTALAHPKC